MKVDWTDEKMDAALSEASDNILPSSGFLDAVMDEVQGEASAFPTIPFPWKRALPGLGGNVLAVGALIALVSAGVTSNQVQANGAPWVTALALLLADFFQRPATLWTLVSICLAVCCVAATRSLESSR